MQFIRRFIMRMLTKFVSELVPAALASAVCAFLFTQYGLSPAAQPRAASNVAGVEMMQMLRNEHASVTDYLAKITEAQRETNLAAEQDIIRMRVAAAERAVEMATAAEKLAMLSPGEARAPAAVVKTHKVAPREREPVQPPMQLAAMMNPPASPPTGNIVTRSARTAMATVERIPAWVREAANWIVDLPAQSLPRWPDRRFLHVWL